MESKLNECLLVIGRKGCGKTTITLELAKVTGKKIITLDDLVHPAYKSFDTVDCNDLTKPLKGNTVVFIEDLDIALQKISHTQRNAAIIIEDSARFISSNISASVRTFIINHRKFNFDIFFMFHSLTDVPPYLCKNYTGIVLFKVGDNLDKEQTKWSNWQHIKSIASKVNKHKSFNHSEIILND